MNHRSTRLLPGLVVASIPEAHQTVVGNRGKWRPEDDGTPG